ncbi:GlxA family transcriptional regulator [Herbaspirillum sp. VT-16-41]|uniref:GlxA family transcriptional regulator n=1 Tax=Herbaspirillum sp. VT-16-41 TaxID=1953765 RepID=UPI000982132A|nr:DJ-1/PfpI family protein [Herbaspirillum sp. VT-16-41]ONN66091.1 AraC family transcriptional regulator [Herbaspirillum sp. VT-16-41]
MKTVTVVIFDGVQSLDVSGPLDVFSEANRFLLPGDRYRLQTVSVDGAAVTCSNGLGLNAGLTWRDADGEDDLLLVAGGPTLVERRFDPAIHAWLRQACARAGKFGSICNGAFMLGRAGLLDHRTVTTHWNDAAALATLCPLARVEADRIYVQDEDLYTSAGVTAGIDLALYLLRQDHGAELALNVAKRLVVVMQRSGGQSQFSPYLDHLAPPDSPIAEVQRHVLANLTQPLSVAELAAVARMSLRSFSRSFSREAGMAPAEFVQRARIDAARAQLEHGTAPIKAIAFACGFGDAGRMRNAFVRVLGVSPQRYRESFGQELGT